VPQGESGECTCTTYVAVPATPPLNLGASLGGQRRSDEVYGGGGRFTIRSGLRLRTM